MALTELEQDFLTACRIAIRALEYEGDDRTAFRGAAFEALMKVIDKAEAKTSQPEPALLNLPDLQRGGGRPAE